MTTSQTKKVQIEVKRTATSHKARYFFIKRLLDLALTSVFIILALPLFPVIALAIYLESGRPIFFNDVRVGQDGKIFIMYKFRTMYTWAPKNSPKPGRNHNSITRIGKILRRTSLDELPQLFNVLKGDMTLVGPRPELPALAEKYDSWQRRRFRAKPGLTGLWQVSGRSNLSLHEKISCDLKYIEMQSLWLDIKIVIRTFWEVLAGTGAF